MKTFPKIATALLSTLLYALPSHAHRPFLLPSSTVVTGSSAWVSIDAAASTNAFEFDHVGLALDGLHISAPDGSRLQPENVFKGRYRNGFDVALKQQGSYKFDLVLDSLFATYTDNGQTKRWRGKAENLQKEIPATATDVNISQRINHVQTFVTNGKPGGKALEVSGHGLEIALINAPGDLVAGEAAQFRLFLDGKPAPNVKVEIVPGGARYRHKLNEQFVHSDAEGRFSLRMAQAGMVWLGAEVKDDANAKAPATSRTVSLTVSLEVLPE